MRCSPWGVPHGLTIPPGQTAWCGKRCALRALLRLDKLLAQNLRLTAVRRIESEGVTTWIVRRTLQARIISRVKVKSLWRRPDVLLACGRGPSATSLRVKLSLGGRWEGWCTGAAQVAGTRQRL